MKKLLPFLAIICLGQIHGQIITTFAGNGIQGFGGDSGQALSAQCHYPYEVAFDAKGNLYVSDAYNNRIRKINSSGIITTIAGTGVGGFSGDNGFATAAQIYTPVGLAFDTIGNLFFSDYQNLRIRKIDTFGIITTVAGNGGSGHTGDNGPATLAQISGPLGIIFDPKGNLYFAEEFGGTIRKIDTLGVITTVAGNGITGFSGDGGPAILAELSDPGDIAFDGLGNLYIADESNNRIRKINTSGIITTVAGTGVTGYSGDNGLATGAQLNIPYGILTDGLGNIFFSDAHNNVIRKINTSGVITTIIGNGTSGFSGDNGAAILAELNTPVGLCFDNSGNLYIADLYNNRIRKVTNIVNDINKIENSIRLNIYPNPTSDQFFINANTSDKLTVDLYDVNGRHVFSANVMDKTNINVSTINEGVYTMTIKTVDRVTNKKLVIVR